MVKLANNFDIATVETWNGAKVNGQPMKLELAAQSVTESKREK